MFQSLSPPTTFREFLDWKPEKGRFELHNGVIVEMQPAGKHEQVAGFLAMELTWEFRKLKLPYFIPNQALVKIPGKESGYFPDVLLVNTDALWQESLWEKHSTLQNGNSIPLVVEVVSTNWRDDYFYKAGDYEAIGIPEYWIVDYLALGGKRFIGNPKQPTISVYHLIDEEYQITQYQGSQKIISPTFPELNLTANQVFEHRIH